MMRLPNGAGSVYKLKGNRRNPWVARKTTGYNEKGHPIYRYIGYFRTKGEALDALSQKAPQIANKSAPTLREMFDAWDSRILCNRSDTYRMQSNYAFEHDLSCIANMPIDELTLAFLQEYFNSIKTPAKQRQIAAILNGILRESVLQGFLSPGAEKVTTYVEMKPYIKKPKVPFSDSELDTLWDSTYLLGAKCALFMCYTGLRVQEFLDLDHVENDRYLIVKKSKTKAGLRTVPIHHRILPFTEELLGINMTYSGFMQTIWKPAMEVLALNKKPHDCRHTFITRMVEAKVDSRLIKAIAGHSGGNVTDDIYTHIRPENLLEAIEVLK